MRIQEVGAKAFVREVIRSERPVLVNFHAAWCNLSLELGPIIEKLADDLASDVKVVRIDSKRSAKLCARLGVRRFPTQMLFVDGALSDRVFGRASAETLREMVNSTVATRKKTLAADEPKPVAMAVEVVDANFGRRVLQSEVPVMAVFWDRFCSASIELIGELDEVAPRHKGTLKIERVQASLAPVTCARLQVTRLPTTLMIQDGEVVDTIGGVLSRETISKVLREYA